jgi:hypothetical protein
MGRVEPASVCTHTIWIFGAGEFFGIRFGGTGDEDAFLFDVEVQVYDGWANLRGMMEEQFVLV